MEDSTEGAEALHPILDRLVQAGWALAWSDSAATGIQVRWNEEMDGTRGGLARFLDFAESLSQLCPETALSASDQAMLVALEAIALDQLK